MYLLAAEWSSCGLQIRSLNGQPPISKARLLPSGDQRNKDELKLTPR